MFASIDRRFARGLAILSLITAPSLGACGQQDDKPLERITQPEPGEGQAEGNTGTGNATGAQKPGAQSQQDPPAHGQDPQTGSQPAAGSGSQRAAGSDSQQPAAGTASQQPAAGTASQQPAGTASQQAAAGTGSQQAAGSGSQSAADEGPMMQGQQIVREDVESEWAHGPTGGEGQPPSPARTAQGEVLMVELGRGVVAVRTDEGPVTLMAEPSELEGLKRGDQVTLAYDDFGGEPWVMPKGQGMRALRGGQQLEGTVESIDEDAGTIEIQGRTLRGHPAVISQVEPGDWVRLTYVEVENDPWVSEIHAPPSGASGGRQRAG